MDILRAEIEHLYARGTLPTDLAVHARHALREFLEALTLGRSVPRKSRTANGA